MDNEKIQQLLREVASTSGYASAQKADELLKYVTCNNDPVVPWHLRGEPIPSAETQTTRPAQETISKSNS